MGYTLKLDIYYFTLKKIEEETIRKTHGEERVIYHTEKNECLLSDFVSSLSIEEINKENYMSVFLENFINGFNSSFKPNKNNTGLKKIVLNVGDQHALKNSTLFDPNGITVDFKKDNE